MERKDKKENNNAKIIFLILLVFGIAYRFIDHAPNFSPLAAISLFAGFYFRKNWTLILPVLVLLASDIFIGFYEWKLMAAVYSSYVFIGIIGICINKNKTIFKAIIGSVAGSCLFFIVTNFAVWCFSNWYVHDMTGLTQCFYMAIPFFRNTLAGDLFFVGVIFGCYEICCFYAKRRVKEAGLSIIR